MAPQVGEAVGVGDEGLAVVLGDDVEDDAGDGEQQSCDDEHDRADERGEARHHAGVHELHGDHAAQQYADDADERAESAEERQGLVFADHAEDGAHDLDAVAYRVELGDGARGAVAVLDGHFDQSQVVVERVDGHFGFDLEAARQDRVGFDECEAERAVAGHDVGDVRAEQSVDGPAHEPVAEVVERAFVLLEVRGAQTVADDHVVAFEDLGDHGGCRVGRVRVVTVGHDIHVRVDVLEHGADYVAFALTGFLTYDGSFRRRDCGRTVRRVVVVHVYGRVGQCGAEVTHDLADRHFLVVAGQQDGDSRNLSLLMHVYHYSASAGTHRCLTA